MEQWMAQHPSPLAVHKVDADDFGGAALHLDHGFILRLFPAGSRGEDWRLFRPHTQTRHFVITGGAVESNGVTDLGPTVKGNGNIA